jgi:NAD(P)-dependent dehydrogenase (short-subunit alcohol dehydrogenase family)
MARNRAAIVTGAQQGIGAALVDGFPKSGYSVVATSLRIVGAVLYLAHARQVTGEILRVDGGAHVGRW